MIQFLNRKVRSSLAAKINLVVVGSLFMLVLVPCLILSHAVKSRLIEKARMEAVDIADLFSEFCAGPLARQSYGILVNNTRNLINREYILSVAIFDEDGDNLIPFETKPFPNDEALMVVERSIGSKHMDTAFGRVVIVFDMTKAFEDANRFFAIMILSSVLIGSGLLVLLTYLLQRYVGAPVKQLRESLTAIAEGNLGHRIEDIGHDELGDLAKHVNTMTSNLGQSMQARRAAEGNLAKLNRELEKKVMERTSKLAEKAVELNRLNKRLTELDDVKSTLLSQVSHELRTPLTSILGFNKLAIRSMRKSLASLDDNPAQVRKSGERIITNLKIVEQEGKRLTRLINDVLDLHKIESGHMEWRDETISINRLISEALDIAEGTFRDNPDVELLCTAPVHLPSVTVDPDRFKQVLINLLNNAAKFTSKGSVSVGARLVHGENVEISVCDTGIGIREEEQAAVFEKFAQAGHDGKTCPLPKGTGLGLSICKEIVEHYQGTIRVDSEYGRGSCFTISMPL